ncbi:MAG: hypothetical protein ACFB22_03140 [Rhodothalassiaceae bacterium]
MRGIMRAVLVASLLLAGCQVPPPSHEQALTADAAGDDRTAYRLYGRTIAALPPTAPAHQEAVSKRAAIRARIIETALTEARALTGGDAETAAVDRLDAAIERLRADSAFDDQAGRLYDAIEFYRDLRNARIASLQDYVDAAEAAMRAGDTDRAANAIAAMEAIDPGEPTAALLREQLTDLRFEQALNAAGSVRRRGDLEAVLAARDRLLTEHPAHPRTDALAEAAIVARKTFIDRQMARAEETGAYYAAYLAVRDLPGYTEQGTALAQLQDAAVAHYLDQAERLEAAERFAAAFLALFKAERIAGRRPEIVEKLLPLQDNVDRKLYKSVAVYAFASPEGAPDIGARVAAELLSRLSQALGYGFRVVDRATTLFQQSVREQQRNPDLAVLTSDYQVSGTISDFAIEQIRDTQEKIVDVPIGTRRQENPLYREWYAAKLRVESAGRRFTVEPPPRYEDVDAYESRRVETGEVRLLGIARGSVRLSRGIQGEVLLSREVAADFQARDQIEPPQTTGSTPLALPARLEVRQDLVDQLVEASAGLILKQFEAREQGLLAAAVDALARRDDAAAYDQLAQGMLYCSRTGGLGRRQACEDLLDLMVEQTEQMSQTP